MDESAVTVSASPSASLNTPLRETCFVPFWLTMVASAMAEATVGARLACCCCCCGATTATSNVSLTRLPSASRAVTVMVAVPSATPSIVSLAPSNAEDTLATLLSEDPAVTVRASPSASLNTPARDTSCVAACSRPVTSARAEATTGAAFTVTVKLSDTVPPLPSAAVTVIVAVPRAFAVTVRLE